jgi:cobyrinic acid a,c-diamide synthase
LRALAEPVSGPIASLSRMGVGDRRGAAEPPILPLGQRIAVADDAAFSFRYAHIAAGWRAAGAEIAPFSPLADEGPDPWADAVYLPGGYPELHAAKLAANAGFKTAMARAADRGVAIFGECGGYMTLGRALTDASGVAYAMTGLLPLETSFAERRLHLGYRQARLETGGVIGSRGDRFRGHEFHYATIVVEDAQARGAAPLFAATDAEGRRSFMAGLSVGRVAGSFLHIVDRADPE